MSSPANATSVRTDPSTPTTTAVASPPSSESPTRQENEMKLDAAETASVGSSGDDSKRPPMKNVSRERMKAETTFLRARVQELERELSHSLAKKALERCATPSPVWRDLAKRQAARREKSEQERDRLRARLLHQLQVAKSLETIFQNRSGAFLDDLCSSSTSNRQQPYPVDNLALLHDQLMDEIDQKYPMVNTLFEEAVELQNVMDRPFRRSMVVTQQTSGAEKLHVELRNFNYVPFPYDRVCSAIWRAITTEYVRQQRIVEQYRCTDDEFSCTFWSPNTPGFTDHHMAGIVMRRFSEENRMVVVWRSLSWDQFPQAKHECTDETGWLTVTPALDSITGELSTESAIVRVCTQCIPIWEVQAKLIEAGALEIEQQALEAASSERSLKVGEVTNRILNGTEEDIAAITESIENILLDESFGSSDVGDIEAIVNELTELDALSSNEQGLDLAVHHSLHL